jgi:hypothetical protein
MTMKDQLVKFFQEVVDQGAFDVIVKLKVLQF